MNGDSIRPFRRATGAIASSLLLLACLAGAPWNGAPAADRLDGEYGLRVWFAGDSVHVGWITSTPVAGFLEVRADDERLATVETPRDSAHHAAFAAGRSGIVTLRYGGAEGDRHETRIDLAAGDTRSGVSFDAPDSLFVMGDTHGEFDTLASVLRAAGLVDDALHWTGGRSHLVMAGDMMDRGADVTRVLWFLNDLERQAAQSGGRVHIVLGNHEIMVMVGDLRYVGEKEARLARLHGVDYGRLFHPEESLLGRWLTSKPGIIRIGDVLIAHGGVASRQLDYTLESFDDTLAAFTHDEAFGIWADTTRALPLDSAGFAARDTLFFDPSSVFWYRGYAQADTLGPALESVLRHFRARIHVVGHTPGPRVREAYDGSLILTNTAPFGREILRLVRDGDGWTRARIGSDGRALPLTP